MREGGLFLLPVSRLGEVEIGCELGADPTKLVFRQRLGGKVKCAGRVWSALDGYPAMDQQISGFSRESELDDSRRRVGVRVLFGTKALEYGGMIGEVEEPAEGPRGGAEELCRSGLDFLEERKWGNGHGDTVLWSTLGGEDAKIEPTGGVVFLER